MRLAGLPNYQQRQLVPHYSTRDSLSHIGIVGWRKISITPTPKCSPGGQSAFLSLTKVSPHHRARVARAVEVRERPGILRLGRASDVESRQPLGVGRQGSNGITCTLLIAFGEVLVMATSRPAAHVVLILAIVTTSVLDARSQSRGVAAPQVANTTGKAEQSTQPAQGSTPAVRRYPVLRFDYRREEADKHYDFRLSSCKGWMSVEARTIHYLQVTDDCGHKPLDGGHSYYFPLDEVYEVARTGPRFMEKGGRVSEVPGTRSFHISTMYGREADFFVFDWNEHQIPRDGSHFQDPDPLLRDIRAAAILGHSQDEATEFEHPFITSSSTAFEESRTASMTALTNQGFEKGLEALPIGGGIAARDLRPLIARINAEVPIAEISEGERGVTYDVILQPGHYGRPPGPVGTSGKIVSERALVAYITKLAADDLRRSGNSVLVVSADHYLHPTAGASDFDGLRAKVFLAVHADGSAHPCSTGPSLAYQSNSSLLAMHAIGFSLAVAVGYEYDEFKEDNFTANEAHYYMFRQVRADRLTGLLEVGELTCPRSEHALIDSADRIGNNLARAIAFIVQTVQADSHPAP